ncbi:MAG TPA: hypothetical protein VFQ71_11910 [Gaiellales bacterium]|nr:hypothetical protein [Gaiellales bacterium]
MIYCVIPREQEQELLPRLREYYRDNPGVEVIVDRRHGGASERRRGDGHAADERRVIRDRRRARLPGTFPTVDDDPL